MNYSKLIYSKKGHDSKIIHFGTKPINALCRKTEYLCIKFRAVAILYNFSQCLDTLSFFLMIYFTQVYFLHNLVLRPRYLSSLIFISKSLKKLESYGHQGIITKISSHGLTLALFNSTSPMPQKSLIDIITFQKDVPK